MSLRDLCDVAYSLLVAQVERHALAVTAGTIAHDKDGEVFGLVFSMRADFDAALAADPVPESPAERLRRELGI